MGVVGVEGLERRLCGLGRPLDWDAASGREDAGDEELEPRATTTAEARAAPTTVGLGATPAALTLSAPAAASRPSQSQGVRPAGTVSVAHLHCGLGYYRDQSGRCRRSRRPPA